MVLATLKPSPKKTSRQSRERWRKDPDVILMLQVKDGNDAAFTELVKAYHSRLLGFFRRHTSDRTAAEDLTQEVFLRIYRYRHSYKPRARFDTWTFFVARNVLRNSRRTLRRHPCVRLNDNPCCQPELQQKLLDDRDLPSRRLERLERGELIRAAVAELGARKRAALELHQFQDRSYAEVGEMLSMTAKAAKSLLHRARLELRDILQPLLS